MIDSAAESRLHYMDAMRSVLMLLGVVLHSARPYGSGTWRVNDAQFSGVFDSLTSALHLFRMPAFFVVAGYFSMLLLSRRATGAFLRERMRRVAVPFAATLLSLNLIQSWFLGRSRTGGSDGFITQVLPADFRNGDLTGHLWFLVCLAGYFLISAALAPALRRLEAPPGRPLPAHRIRTLTLALTLAVAIVAPLALAVVAKLTGPALGQVVLGLIATKQLLVYLPFFAVGVVLFARPGLLNCFASHGAVVIALGLLAALGSYLTAGREDIGSKAVQILCDSVLAWMAVRVVFALFRRWTSHASALFRYLSDASYSVYLFHHLLVVVAATWLLPVDIAIWLKFLLVLTAASVVSLAMHHFLVRRYAVLRYLFNGRTTAERPKRAVPVPVPVAKLDGVIE